MGRLQIDAEDLYAAFTQQSAYECWLDLETGEVLEILPDSDDNDSEQGPANLRRIPLLPPYVYWYQMQYFAEQQSDESLREALLDSLDRAQPLQRFKQVLEAHPQAEAQWAVCEQELLQEEALHWLEDEDIDALLTGIPA